MAESLHVRLIAPSGWPAPDALQRGVERLRQHGCVVSGADAALRRHQRFAGSDAERAQDINALADPDQPLPDIVMAVRGGYGVHRLLPRLDYGRLQARLAGSSCIIVGHSDLTALGLALLARAGLATFAGPMLAYDFGGQTTSRFTLEHFWATIGAPRRKARWQGRSEGEVDAAGTLWGGNLAVLCSLLGTPYLPAVEGGILFVEDVFEPAYRIERLLYQLKLSGVLDRQRALLLGDFSNYRRDEYDPAYDMDAIVRHIREITDIPVVTGLPFGHCRDKLTLPVGVQARLRAGESGLVELDVAGYPHLEPEPVAAEQSGDS